MAGSKDGKKVKKSSKANGSAGTEAPSAGEGAAAAPEPSTGASTAVEPAPAAAGGAHRRTATIEEIEDEDA